MQNYKQDQKYIILTPTIKTRMLLRRTFLNLIPTPSLFYSSQSKTLAQRYLFSFSTSSNEGSLESLIQSERTIQILNKKGINSLFPIQYKTYNHIYAGKDVIAGDKTGSGKTMAFTVPVIERLRKQNVFASERGIKFVIMAPTRELALQIHNEIQSLKHSPKDFKSLAVFGGTSVSQNVRALMNPPDILVGTPGRMQDLINKGCLTFESTRVVCVDEADHMFDIGFQKQIHSILSLVKSESESKVQFICFSATLNREVTEMTSKFMQRDKVHVKLSDDSDNRVPETIEHYYIKSSFYDKILAIKHLILNHCQNKKVIIFTNRKSDADELSQNLKIRNVVLHGDINQVMRMQRLKMFKDGFVKVLIASDVAARGLDIPNVEMVINYEVPPNYEGYIHRSGRTGRAGKQGTCVSLIVKNKSEVPELKMIQNKTGIQFSQLKISKEELEAASKAQPQEAVRYRRDEELYSPNSNFNVEYKEREVVLYENGTKLDQESLQQFLESKNINTKSIKQVVSSSSGNSLFIMRLFNNEDTEKLLKLEIQFNGVNLKFKKSLVKPRRDDYQQRRFNNQQNQ